MRWDDTVPSHSYFRAQENRPKCSKCLKNLAGKYPANRGYLREFRDLCDSCRRPGRGRRGKKKYGGAVKKPSCEKCGFAAVDPCQLDIDHIDGNHKNNAPENLQTLCSNCHRLKTKLNKEGINKEYLNPLSTTHQEI